MQLPVNTSVSGSQSRVNAHCQPGQEERTKAQCEAQEMLLRPRGHHPTTTQEQIRKVPMLSDMSFQAT